MAARPFWSGQLQISLVSFGIQLFPATNAKSDVAFHQIDRRSHQRIHHLNVVNGDKPVADADIVKGYESSKGQYVIVEPAEIKKLCLETQKAIRVAQFVDAKELPPSLFEKPYFVVPDAKGSVEAFAVVREAMTQADKVAIGEVAFGGREHLVAIAPSPNRKDRGMMAYTLRYAEELRDAKDFFSDISAQAIDKKQLAMAQQLIESYSESFDAAAFKDDFEAALREFVQAKLGNKPCRNAIPRQSRGKVIDLMDALKRSLASAGKSCCTRCRAGAGKVENPPPQGRLMPARTKKTTKQTESPAAAVEAQLARYREMRDFSTTAEPRGAPKAKTPSDGLPFVIQKHAATRFITTSAWAGMACSKAGLLPRGQATSSRTSASPSRSKITPWNTAASRAPSPRDNTAAAP